ncbi:MAG: methyltransferase domain-containing protein, partial [Vicinamibacterales bacterium]
MKLFLMDVLACPWCGGTFELESFDREPEPGVVHEGILTCGCQRAFPIVRGIPRILEGAWGMFPEFAGQHAARLPAGVRKEAATASQDAVVARTADSFGYQWTFFSEMAIDFKANFLDYIQPLDEHFFKGKLGLDLGCGFGRHVYNAALFGAEMLAVDISDAIESTSQNTGHLPNVHPVQADIYHLPFRPATFDFAYSIGVLHHLPDPETGFQGMVRLVKPGGAAFIWVYSKSRRWVNRVLERVRQTTTRMSKEGQQFVALSAAVVDWGAFILPYRVLAAIPGLGRLFERVMFPRLRLYSRYPFQVVWADWFDRLAAPVRFYYNEKDLKGWMARAGLLAPRISPTGLFGWRAYGTQPGADGQPVAEAPVSRPDVLVAKSTTPTASTTRILAVATNPETGASTRFRILQWRSLLDRHGFSVRLDAFFSREATGVLYKPGHSIAKSAHFITGAARRYLTVSRAEEAADILLVHREMFPLGRRFLLNRFERFPGARVYDYDDAMFLPQRQSRGLLSRLERLDTAKAVMGMSDVVIAGNEYLADYARQFNSRVVMLPTCIDTARFRPGATVRKARTDTLTIGWIGSHSTAKYLHSLRPLLEKIASRNRFRLFIVGSDEPMRLYYEVHMPWSLERVVDDFLECDIGIYPRWDVVWA